MRHAALAPGAVARRKALAAAMVALALLPLTAPLSAQPASGEVLTPGDWREIQRVIEAQRLALVAGEGERAFEFAAPGVRRQLGDAAAFMRMVRDGYAALLAARHTQFLEGAVIGGDVVQPLRLVMPDETVFVAIYGMLRQPDGSWRIGSCVIAPSTVRSA